MTTYWEKLKDPRWQRKRLEVMEYANFSCQDCGDGTTTLNVHHKFYRKKAEPWDYAKEELACLCEPCHAKHHDYKRAIEEVLVDASSFELPAIHALIVGRMGHIVSAAGVAEEFATATISPDCLHEYWCGCLAEALTDVSCGCVQQLMELFRETGPDMFPALISTSLEKIKRERNG